MQHHIEVIDKLQIETQSAKYHKTTATVVPAKSDSEVMFVYKLSWTHNQ